MNGMNRNIAIDPGLVRAKAYEIWQSMGCPEGAADQTWFEAERQLMSRSAKPERQDSQPAARVIAEERPAVASAPTSEPPPASRDRAISQPPAESATDHRSKKGTSSARRTTRR
jgi:hypothetical protein